MNFTLHQLEIFLKVTQTGNITKAAEELFLSQPAVSIQLKNLQDQFDIPLTEVIGKKVYITDFGKDIAEIAKKIILEVEYINTKSLEYGGHLTGTLRVSIVSTAKYIFPYLLSGFTKLYPEVKLHINVTNKSTVTDQLLNNEVDFGMVSILPSNLQLNTFELMDNTLCLIGGKSSEVKRVNEWTKFDKIPLIVREKGSATRNAMELFFEKNKIHHRMNLELMSNEAVKQAVVAGLGYSIMPIIGLKNELASGDVRIVPMKGLPLHTKWSIVWLQGKKQSPIASAFIDFLNKEKNHIIEEHFAWMNKIHH
jgi:LysR family transcriptional regulator, low CO2-responsive transcriptional regulator